MSETDTLRREAARGHVAEALLNDPLLKEAFDAVDANLRAGWTNTTDGQERERERLWMMVKLLGSVRGYLEEYVTTGKIAARQLEGPTLNG